MDSDQMRRRVAAARVGRLATVDAAGPPHLVPVCFALVGDTVVSAVDAKPKSTRALRRVENVRVTPVATLLVDHYEEDWSGLWWVRLRGPAAVLGEGPRARRALAALVDKYEQYRRDRPPGPVIALTVTGWAGWEASPGVA